MMVVVARQTQIFNKRRPIVKSHSCVLIVENYGDDKVACPSKEDDESEAGQDAFQCYLKEREVSKLTKCFFFLFCN